MKTRLFFFVIAVIYNSNASYAQEWHIIGNSGTNPSKHFIGTSDKVALNMRTNNIVRLSITSSGNVGIGTTKPKLKLDVAGGITAYSSYFTRQDGAPGVSIGRSGANYGSVGYGLTFTDTTDKYRYNITDFSSMLSFKSGGFDFNTAPSGPAGTTISYTTAMTILQNGNLGIGTTIPAYKFHVTALPPQSTPVAFIENTGGTIVSDGLYIKGGSLTNVDQGAIFINFLRTDGLQLARIQQENSFATFFSSSDKRLKNIIGTSQKGLSDLMKIKIYDYTFKSDAAKKIQTGFMAQELYEVFPQAVSKPRNENETPEKDPWMVDYGRVTPLIIKAVQEQQQVIEELKNNYEAKINDLQSQINELKAMIASSQSSTIISSALLQQNIPNPFNHTTTINYSLPQTYSSAKIIITDKAGKVLKEVNLSAKGKGSVQVEASTLSSGAYQYSLYVDGRLIDIKQMLLAK